MALKGVRRVIVWLLFRVCTLRKIILIYRMESSIFNYEMDLVGTGRKGDTL